MVHTKKQVENVVRKLMKDINRPYYEQNEIYIEFIKNEHISHYKKTVENCWLINVDVHDDQFNEDEPASIIMYVNDDTLKFEGYLDCSMGRPVPLLPKKEPNGKFYLGKP